MFEISVTTKEWGTDNHTRETWQGVLNLFGDKNLSKKSIEIVERPNGQRTIKDYGYPHFKRGELLIRD